MKHVQAARRAAVGVLSALILTASLAGCTETHPADSTDTEDMTTMKETEKATEPSGTGTETAYTPQGTLAFRELTSPVYLCNDKVRAYLDAGAQVDIHNFDYHGDIQAQAVEVTWDLAGAVIDGYTLEIAAKPDYSDAGIVTLKADAVSYGMKFLLRDTTYYLRLTTTGQDVLCAETSFTTAYTGPRFLDVGGLYHNCRDLGGYRVGDRVTAYDRIIRGSSPDNCSDAGSNTLTREGKEFLTNTIGVRTQLDLRGTGENCNRTKSSFKGANYVHIPLTAYAPCFSAAQAELYREAFLLFVDPDNYPIYFHCVGGADRTGTLSALLLALAGVSEDEIVQDYVVTSFTPVCHQQDARSRENIMTVLNGLKNYSGDTLSDKCRSYLVSIGLTQQQIYAIRANMFGDDPDAYVPVADYGILLGSRFINTASGDGLTITLNEEHPVKDVQLGGASLAFSQDGRVLTVAPDALKALADGVHTGCVVFGDGGQTAFSLNVNFVDLTGDLQVTGMESHGDYTFVYVKASEPVFDGVDYHFHTRRDSTFPDVEPHILINGQLVMTLNATVDLSGRTWTSSPGSTDARHRVPVSILSNGDTMKLLIRADWLEEYLAGEELTITLQAGLSFTTDGGTYRVLSDVTYRYTGGVWVKVV